MVSGPMPSFLEIRGEVYIEKESFDKLNLRRIKEGEEPFANPRNAAAGSLRQLDSKNDSAASVKHFPLRDRKRPRHEFFNPWGRVEEYRRLGISVNPLIERATDINSCIQYFERIGSLRENLPYEIDGVVIKVDSLILQKTLGNVSRNPRWALACKFPAAQATTVVREIFCRSRTHGGTLTPVAIMEPVNVGGVMVSRATMSNKDDVRKKDVRVGDTVVVQRAGDVIPEIVRVILEKDRRALNHLKCPTVVPNAVRRSSDMKAKWPTVA